MIIANIQINCQFATPLTEVLNEFAEAQLADQLPKILAIFGSNPIHPSGHSINQESC